ncbi:MAG: hypothetical protein L0Z50_23110 [Verrucomicrobiales bacterium]|nr:hypothetical protein [Verrucomicrobiales bacterium]
MTTILDEQHLEAAQAHGLKVLARPWTSAGELFDAERARTAIAAFDRHPALWAWYVVDEPDLHRVAPTAVREVHRFIKGLGATKPTALVIFQGSTALEYANIVDITMIDRYPIPWLPLANFPQHVRMARLALGPHKPLIAVIQAFDWSAYPDLLPGRRNLRFPTYAELRCMTYCALVRQANGLFYYCFDDGRWQLQEHAELWQSLTNVVAEVNARLPLFKANHVWWPYDHDFGDPAHAFNEALESSVTPAMLQVEEGNGTVAAGNYVLAVNTTERAHQYRFRLPKVLSEDVAVLGEGRTRPVRKGWVEDEFGPFAVHVYGPLRLSDGVRSKNLRTADGNHPRGAWQRR